VQAGAFLFNRAQLPDHGAARALNSKVTLSVAGSAPPPTNSDIGRSRLLVCAQRRIPAYAADATAALDARARRFDRCHWGFAMVWFVLTLKRQPREKAVFELQPSMGDWGRLARC
jgi:hypothetical protein